MRALVLPLILTLAIQAGPLAAQRMEPSTVLAGFGGFGADPVTAAVGLEARYSVSSFVALSASVSHWFLVERCDSALVGPCTPSDAWLLNVGTRVVFASVPRGWQPFATVRTGPVRFNYKPSTVWMASTGVGVGQTGRSVGLEFEVRYHALFGGTSPPPDAVADRLVLYAGVRVTP